MKTFKRYVVESEQLAASFEKAKKIAPYIKSQKYRELYLEALDELVKATRNKEIYKARFGEFKNRMTRGIEYGYTGMFDTIKDDLISQKQETIDLWSITTTAEIKKVAKIYEKMNPKNKTAIEFMDAIKDIPQAMKDIKPYIKSGRPPKEPKPGQFVKPLASVEATKLAVQFMKEATSSFEKKLRDSITKDVNDAYNRIKNIEDPKKLPKGSSEKAVALTIFKTAYKEGKKVLELMPSHETRLKKLIDNNVTDIVDGFVGKTSSKLALILQKKDKPLRHKILSTNIRNGKVENTMSFEFNDGSSFKMKSSVVYKYSQTGKLFFQYPTRFSNVKLADGTRMKLPSEQKMVEEF